MLPFLSLKKKGFILELFTPDLDATYENMSPFRLRLSFFMIFF